MSTPSEEEARAQALREYSHSKVRDRYDADLLMAGFIDGVMWAASRVSTPPSEEWEYGVRRREGFDVYPSRHDAEWWCGRKGFDGERQWVVRRRPGTAPGDWEPVPAGPVLPTDEA